ncbi:MAG: DotA/TraY family protein, partial [Pseudonocardiaceae bacterium]
MKRLIAALLGILPTTLFAQAAPEQPGFFKPPADDTSVGFLRDIFGNIVDTVMAGNTEAIPVETPLAAGMQIFGTGILVLSMLFVIYTTIKGAIDTAHDGEFLGKKMSSVWVPLRTAGGTALLLPLASGFSLIQIAVLWIAIHGVGLADRVWLAMAEQMAATGMVGRPAIPDSRPLAASILRAEVCMAAMNKTYAARGDAVRVVETSSTEIVLNDGRIAIGGPISDTAQSLLTYR